MKDMAVVGVLREHGLRPTQQRIAIYRYLLEHPVHPTAEVIFRELKPTLPSCSLMTVYNALDALAEAGLVRVVTVEAGVQHFDATVGDHGHFRCKTCSHIYDFPLTPENVSVPTLSGFQIQAQDLYCTGICPTCASAQ